MDRKKNITPITNADYQAVINNSVQGAGSRLVGSAAEQKKLFVRPIANTDGSPNVMDYIKRLVTELAEVIAEGDLAVDELADAVDNATKELETKLTTTNKSEVLYGTDKEGKSKHYKLTDVNKPIKGVDYWTDDDKQEINEYIDKEIAEFDFVKVLDELPEFGLPNREYFIRKENGDTNDLFDEWAWINRGTEESPNWGWEFKGTKKFEVEMPDYVKFTDIANTTKAGVVKINNAFGIRIDSNGALMVDTSNDTEIAEQRAVNSPLKPNQIPKVVKSGLVKHDSVTLTDEEKASACDWIGAIPDRTSAFSGYEGKVLLYNSDGTFGFTWLDRKNATPYTVARRTDTGALFVGTPTESNHAVNVQYAEDNFLAKPTNSEEKLAACKAIGAVQSVGAGGSFVYGADIYGDTIIQYSTSAIEDRLAQRDGDGVLHGNAPTTDTGLVNKQYAEANFIAKVTDTSTQNRVYGVAHSGTTTAMFDIQSGGTNQGTIPMRNANGQFDVRTPQSELNVANKKYVDDAIANISVSGGGGTKLYLHKIYATLETTDGEQQVILSVINPYRGTYNEYSQFAVLFTIHNGHTPLFFAINAPDSSFATITIVDYLVVDEALWIGTMETDGLYYYKVKTIAEIESEVVEL